MAVKKKVTKKIRKAAAKRPVRKATRKKAAKKAAPKKAAKSRAKKTIKESSRSAGSRTSQKTSRAAAAVHMPAAVSKRKEMLKALLYKKRSEVVQGLESQMGRKLMFETGQKIDSAMDSADQSAQDVDQGIDYSIIEMKYGQYKDIADAFRKFQNDTYGVCEECGGEISIKRLEVNPLARYCIECKTRKEEIEKIQKEETRFKE